MAKSDELTLAERLESNWNLMRAWMEKARDMKVGRKYTLYKYLNNDKTSAVKLERTLQAKYPNIAVFVNKKNQTFSYTYVELAEMIQPLPPECKVKTERQHNMEWLDRKE